MNKRPGQVLKLPFLKENFMTTLKKETTVYASSIYNEKSIIDGRNVGDDLEVWALDFVQDAVMANSVRDNLEDLTEEVKSFIDDDCYVYEVKITAEIKKLGMYEKKLVFTPDAETPKKTIKKPTKKATKKATKKENHK